MRVDNHARLNNVRRGHAGRASARFHGKKKMPFEKVSGARQHPVTIAENVNALSLLFARLAGSRGASASAGRKGQAYVMRVDTRA
jgi:hypothetical protein